MATKTVILRPVSVVDYGGSITLYPSDTPIEDAYLLVNETDGDFNGTYIELTNASDTYIVLGYDYIAPGAVSSAQIFIQTQNRINATPVKYFVIEVSITAVNGSALCSESITIEITHNGTSANWKLISGSLENALTALSDPSARSVNCRISHTSSSSKTARHIISQMYIELVYEENEVPSDLLYIRENGAWAAVEGTVYCKENGAWVEADETVFTQGDQFALNVIN